MPTVTTKARIDNGPGKDELLHAFEHSYDKGHYSYVTFVCNDGISYEVQITGLEYIDESGLNFRFIGIVVSRTQGFTSCDPGRRRFAKGTFTARTRRGEISLHYRSQAG